MTYRQGVRDTPKGVLFARVSKWRIRRGWMVGLMCLCI